jgi:hypothetical protein
MDPLDVLTGAGAQTHAGRFVPCRRPRGLSVGDRLGGEQRGHSTQVATRWVGSDQHGKYPRVVHTVALDLQKVLSLSTLGSTQEAGAVRTACLDKDDLSTSMELARELIAAGLLFPSVVGGDHNLVVYRVNCGRKALSQKRTGGHRSGAAIRRQTQELPRNTEKSDPSPV